MPVPDVYRALWRHKLLVVFLSACVVAAAWLVTSRERRIYEASTLVRIQQQIQSAGDAFSALQTSGRLAQTYAQIVQTSTMAKAISDELHGSIPTSAIIGDVSGSQVQDLDLLAIKARSPSPHEAELIANAAPAALRAFIAHTGTIRDEIITVQPASYPRSPASPDLKLNLALALLLGLVFNGGLAVLIDILGDRFREPEELEQLTGLPVLAVIPNLEFVAPGSVESALPMESLPAAAGQGRPWPTRL